MGRRNRQRTRTGRTFDTTSAPRHHNVRRADTTSRPEHAASDSRALALDDQGRLWGWGEGSDFFLRPNGTDAREQRHAAAATSEKLPVALKYARIDSGGDWSTALLAFFLAATPQADGIVGQTYAGYRCLGRPRHSHVQQIGCTPARFDSRSGWSPRGHPPKPVRSRSPSRHSTRRAQ